LSDATVVRHFELVELFLVGEPSTKKFLDFLGMTMES
jgi:hypothetical protein